MTELKDGILSGAARPHMQALASEEAFSETSSAPEGGSLWPGIEFSLGYVCSMSGFKVLPDCGFRSS